MAKVVVIKHKGKELVHMDFSYSEIGEVMQAIEDGKKIISAYPENSVLGLVDVSESTFDSALAEALKEFSMHNKPFIKMSAIVGVTGIKKVIYQAVLAFTGRKNLVMKNSVEEAKDWLVEQ